MTLVQLPHPIALAQTGSFSRSAGLLFLTQPALSRSICTFNDYFQMRAEAEEYRIADALGGRGKVKMYSVNFVFPFGRGL
jgi:hypothetical protein